jgi:hypothetical protein
MPRSISAIILALGLLTAAGAHDASLHKGKATAGEIISVSGDQVKLKTASGPVTVTLNEKTKFEHGNKNVDRSHLQKGQKVSVFGVKLPSGQLVAKEIVVAPDSSAAHK